jgi:hypothetical protein
MLQADGIVVHVVNDSATGESTRVVIYQNTGAGAIVAVDIQRQYIPFMSELDLEPSLRFRG